MPDTYIPFHLGTYVLKAANVFPFNFLLYNFLRLAGGRMADPILVETFLTKYPEETRRIVYEIVKAIQKADAGLCMAIKWNQLTFTKDNDFHHWICGIRLLKSSVNLYYHFGGLLEDPDRKLSSGSSKFGRWIVINHEKEIVATVIEDFTKKAIEKLPFFKVHWKEIQAGVLAEK